MCPKMSHVFMSLASRRLKQDSFSAGSGMVGIETTQVAPGSTFELLTVGNMMFPPSRLGCNYDQPGCSAMVATKQVIPIIRPTSVIPKAVGSIGGRSWKLGAQFPTKITPRGPVF
jgi:hypothetical protein